MTEGTLSKKSEKYARDVFSRAFPVKLSYHNEAHTLRVVEAVRLLAEKSELSSEQKEELEIAAWFHDLGYKEQRQGHEEVSKEMAKAFLEKEGASETCILNVTRYIEVTRMDTAPETLPEMVIKDADLSHLADTDCYEQGQLIKKELKEAGYFSGNEEEWLTLNVTFLGKIEFYTPFAKEQWEPKKAENLKDHKKRLKRIKKKHLAMEVSNSKKDQKIAKLEAKLTEAKNKPGRGVETFFRVSARTNLDLSSMADNKANILISVNAIIISIIFAGLLNNAQEAPLTMVIPAVLLLLVALGTIIFAVRATIPKLADGRFKEEDVETKKANLLFFGNYYNMPVNSFMGGMNKMINDEEYLYSSLMRDHYFHGLTIAKKFKRLRIAYMVFMAGLGLVVISMLVAILIFGT